MPPLETVAGLRMCWALENWSCMGVTLLFFIVIGSSWRRAATMPHCRLGFSKESKMAGVKQARDGAVGVLTLNEPASLNAMTPDLFGGLAARSAR
jgi:hypothetical protein